MAIEFGERRTRRRGDGDVLHDTIERAAHEVERDAARAWFGGAAHKDREQSVAPTRQVCDEFEERGLMIRGDRQTKQRTRAESFHGVEPCIEWVPPAVAREVESSHQVTGFQPTKFLPLLFIERPGVGRPGGSDARGGHTRAGGQFQSHRFHGGDLKFRSLA